MSAWQQQATACGRPTAPSVPHQLHSPKTWMPLDGSCSGETALDFQPTDGSYDILSALASSLGREPPATAITTTNQARSDSGRYRLVTDKAETLSNGLLSGAGEKKAANLNKKTKATKTQRSSGLQQR